MPEVKKGCDRSAKIDRAKIDKEKRTVELAFSSEMPVERWGENEVLSHDKGDYDFSRIASGAHPLLLGHAEYDPTSQIGVVESARVDADKMGRAVVRFGNSLLANEIFQDVQDGIRQLVSVGYDRTSIASSEKSSDGMVTTRYRWMPTHIAVVPVPADTRVGVGRAKAVDSPETVDVENVAKNLTPEQRQQMKRSLLLLDPAPAITAPTGGGGSATVAVVDEAKVRTTTLEGERTRIKEISTVAETLTKNHPHCSDKIRTITTEAIGTGMSLGDYQIKAMREVLDAKPAKQVTMTEIGMNKREQNEYSILRGIQSCILRNSKVPDGLEGDVHKAIIERKDGVGYQGFAVPADANVRCKVRNGRERRQAQRDLQVNVFNQGGATVATELITPIIEILRNRMVTQELGVQSLAGLEGNIAIPRQTGAATPYSLSEIAALTSSTQALDQISLSPKRVGATENYSKQLLLQSSIDVENFIRDDLMKVIAINWDFLILQGNGAASQPIGILNTPGIGAVIFGATPTWAKIISFETQLNLANALQGRLAWVTSPAVKGSLKATAKIGTTFPVFIWENEEMNSYPALATNQIQNNLVFFGNWEEAIHALWGGYDVVVDPYSLAKNGEVVITINTYGDVAVRHPVSFCVSSDAGNQ